MKRSAIFTSVDETRVSRGIATTEDAAHLGQVVFVTRGVVLTPDDVESGTLGVYVDRYGDPREGAPQMVDAARATGWEARLVILRQAPPQPRAPAGSRT
jgi:hypothetical protein